MKIAEILGFTGIELNYLYVSRRALLLAYLAQEPRRRILEVSDNNTLIGKTHDNILKKLGINRESTKLDFGISFPSGVIKTKEQEESFLDMLFNDTEFSKSLVKKFEEAASITYAYFKQEGLTERDIQQAMVDLGWVGTSRHMINSILGANIPTYYLGVRDDVLPHSSGEYISFFDRSQLNLHAIALLENYFAACPYPTTIGYQRTANLENAISPIFGLQDDCYSSEIPRCNIEICERMASILKNILGPNLHDSSKPTQTVTNGHLLAWSQISLNSLMQFSDDIDLLPLTKCVEFEGRKVAKTFSLRELWNHIVFGERITEYDKASLILTTGKKNAIRLKKIASLLYKTRYILQLRLSYLKRQFSKLYTLLV